MKLRNTSFYLPPWTIIHIPPEKLRAPRLPATIKKLPHSIILHARQVKTHFLIRRFFFPQKNLIFGNILVFPPPHPPTPPRNPPPLCSKLSSVRSGLVEKVYYCYSAYKERESFFWLNNARTTINSFCFLGLDSRV